MIKRMFRSPFSSFGLLGMATGVLFRYHDHMSGFYISAVMIMLAIEFCRLLYNLRDGALLRLSKAERISGTLFLPAVGLPIFLIPLGMMIGILLAYEPPVGHYNGVKGLILVLATFTSVAARSGYALIIMGIGCVDWTLAQNLKSRVRIGPLLIITTACFVLLFAVK